MPLTGTDVARLAGTLDAQLDLPGLQLLAADLGITLAGVTGGGTIKMQALELISHLNGSMPPRDRELLEKLRNHPNAEMKRVAADLLAPTFLSPTGDPHDAVLLGKLAFVARPELRRVIREFTSPTPNSTRVLVVRGEHPGGKSYSFEFLRHLAFSAVGAQAIRVRALGIDSPRELLRRALLQLGLSTATLVDPTDAPQPARAVEALMPSFSGELLKLNARFWLAIDDLNDEKVTRELRESALAMAKSVEELKSQYLWVALLGYNDPITDNELRHIAIEDAEFPSEVVAAEFLEIVAQLRFRANDRCRSRG